MVFVLFILRIRNSNSWTVQITSQYSGARTLLELFSLAAFFLRIFDKFKHVERKNNVFDQKFCTVEFSIEQLWRNVLYTNSKSHWHFTTQIIWKSINISINLSAGIFYRVSHWIHLKMEWINLIEVYRLSIIFCHND